MHRTPNYNEMIIPANNEDDILRELLDDYKSVQRKAKKIAMAELEKMARYGKQEKKTELASIGVNLNMYTLDQVFTAIAAKYPGIEPYIKHAEGLYILYL